MVEGAVGRQFISQKCWPLKTYGIQISMGCASLTEEYRVHLYTSRMP